MPDAEAQLQTLRSVSTDKPDDQVKGGVGTGDAVFVEGLVHVNRLEDDYYEFREEEYALVGDRRGKRFRLGDRVRVQVSRVDKEERQIDFTLEVHRG